MIDTMGQTFRNEKTFSRKNDRQATLANARIRDKARKEQNKREEWHENYARQEREFYARENAENQRDYND